MKQPPPPIAFAAPKLVDSNEFTEEYEVTFASAVETGAPNNDTVRVTVIVPADRRNPIPGVLVLHYWGAVDLRVERSLAIEMAKRGIGSAIMTLPYHISRTPPGYRSGELAIQPDPALLRTVMLQSVLDARRTLDWMVEWGTFDPQRIGIEGTSLGAIVASLVFAVEPRFTCGSFVLGGIDLAHILWNSTKVVEAREPLRRKGFTEERIREALAPVEPGNFLHPDEARPTLVIGARNDTVVPFQDTQKLAAALGSPFTIWLDTGHYGGALVERRILRSVASFFSSAFEKKPFSEPARLYAPVIRIGFQANIEQGLQVVAGFDLWRSNAPLNLFASALATPRGVQGFIGKQFTREISLGVVLLPKRVTVGFFWSQVF